MRRIELEKVIVEGVRLVDHFTPDIISLRTEEGFAFEVKTYRLIDGDMAALRGAILGGEATARFILEVEE